MSALAPPAGCERSAPDHEAGGRAARRAPADAPKPDALQELVVGAGQDEFGLALNRPRLGMYPLNAGICEPLLRLTYDFQVEPWLATRWEYRGDNTYRFTLRPGVKFNDGQPFNAEAVKYTLDRAVLNRNDYSFLYEESVLIVDDTTVYIRPCNLSARDRSGF